MFKKILTSFTLALSLFLGGIFSSSANATIIDSCTPVVVTPESGDFNVIFEIRTQCTYSPGTRLNIVVNNPSGQPVDGPSTEVFVAIGGSVSYSTSLNAESPIGRYTINLFDIRDPDGISLNGSFTLTESTPGNPAQKTCCTVRSDDVNFCSSVPALVEQQPGCVVPANGTCPTNCQSVPVSGCPNLGAPLNQLWLCAGTGTANTAEMVAGECIMGTGWVDTAIGCIPFDAVQETAKFFLQWGLSIGGGIALALIAISGFMFATSSGDPKKLENSKSMLFSAIGGLLMIVLSVFLLRFIGVNVLGLFS